MASFIQLLVSGLATGAIYALIAVGFTLLWQTSQTINFAQGEFVMLPAFFILAAMNLGAPFWLAALIGIALSIVVLGLLFKLIIVDPMLKHGVLPLVISTIALSLFLKEAAKDFYSSQAQPFPALVPATDVHVFGAVVSTQSLAVLAVAIVDGRGAASAAQQDAARPLHAGDRAKSDAGAHSRHSGAADGALHVSDQWRARRHRLDPDQPDLSGEIHQRRDLGMAAFLAAIIGGFNQVRGAILGGIILGILDNLSAAYISSQYRGAFPLLILIAVILLRPQGLLGRIEERTV